MGKTPVTPTQLEALCHGHYLDDEAPVVVEGRAITYTDKDAAWTALVDAANLADEWATHWREHGAPDLAKYAARDARALANLSSKVLRATVS